MATSITLSDTGSVSQSSAQNLQNNSTQPLIPVAGNLQPQASSTETNLNTSNGSSGIRLSQAHTDRIEQSTQPNSQTSATSFLLGLGLIIIFLAILGMVTSNTVLGRRSSVD